MSWQQLAGSYFETCSCDVVCPCTASLAIGATHDRCRVTLVCCGHDGGVEGIDVSGLTIARPTRSKIDAFGVRYEGTSGLPTPQFSWAA